MLEENPLYCKYSRKIFASEGAYNSYLKGKNFQKAKKWYESNFKVCFFAEVPNQLRIFVSLKLKLTAWHPS